MFLIKVIVVRVTLLNINLFTWATLSDFLRLEDIDPDFDTRSREGLALDDFTKYSFEKRLCRKKTTEGTLPPTISEYETEEQFSFNENERQEALKIKNFTLDAIKNLPPSSETEFVGGWDEYPLFATPTPVPSMRDHLRALDRQLSKQLSNPQRYPVAMHISYLAIFHDLVEEILRRLVNYDDNVMQLAADLGRGDGPFFIQQPLDNDTLRNLGWSEDNIYEFYTLYDDVKTLFWKIKRQNRRLKYDAYTKEHMTSEERRIARPR